MKNGREKMTENNLVNQWKKDEKAIFQGWDFSFLKNRMIQHEPPWDYIEIAKKLIKESNSVLDMETGGGEFFSKLAPFPKHAVAYEGYKPNVPIAKKRLEPLGVEVKEVKNVKKLPFKEQEFDLVLNRHGAVNGKEIYRILKKGGKFFTQQVTGSNELEDIIKEFGAKRKFANITLKEYKKELEDAGFKIIEFRDWRGKITFNDIGAIVYYLKAMPWVVEGFSVDNNLEDLERLQKKINKNKKIEFEQGKFMILAIKE